MDVPGSSLFSFPPGAREKGIPKQLQQGYIDDAVAFAAGITILMVDLGWLMDLPSLFLLGVFPGLILQCCCVGVELRHRNHLGVTLQISMLLWLIGCTFWGGSDLTWPVARGVFAHVRHSLHLDRSYYAYVLFFSTLVNAGAVAVPLIVYGLSFRRQGRSNAEIGQSESCSQAWHHILYVVVWLLANVAWNFGNYGQEKDFTENTLLALGMIIISGGVVSLSLGAQVVNIKYREEQFRTAIVIGSDVLWVGGNVVWATADILSSVCLSTTTEQLMRKTSAVIFVVCGVLMILSRFVSDGVAPQPKSFGDLVHNDYVRCPEGSANL